MTSLPGGVPELVGGTPLVRLTRLLEGPGPTVLAKLESANPGGSAKDRTAAEMLRGALARGDVRPGGTVVESSSGNLGVALAQLCRWHGLRFVCVVDPRTNTATRRLMAAYGAEVHEVSAPDPSTGDWLAARLAAVRDVLDRNPGAYWPDQYANLDNPRAHARGTMLEILDAMEAPPTVLLVATSTTGTLLGCAAEIHRRGLSTRVVAVDAEGSVLFGGNRGPRALPGFGAGVVPGLAAGAHPDHVVRVSDLDCVVGCRRLVDREALLAGASGGGVVSALGALRHRLTPDDRVVLLLHDGGERYLDTVYDDAWVREHLGCDPADLAARVREPWLSWAA